MASGQVAKVPDPGSEQAAERVTVERVAELQVFVEHSVALVPAELLEAGGWTPRSMPVVSAPRLRLCPPSARGSKPAAAARALMIWATVPASMAGCRRGQGGGASPRRRWAAARCGGTPRPQ